MQSCNSTMLKAITNFLNNIYYAKGRNLDTAYLPMWTREIVATGATIPELNKAELEIIRENVPLIISEICDVIRRNKTAVALPPINTDCPYCEGRGYVHGLKFEKNGKYTGYRVALNCCCGSHPTPNMAVMREDLSNFHKTETATGYVLIFPSIVEEFAYLDKVYANDDYDLRRE